MKKKGKDILPNTNAITSILELVIAAAIIFVILAFFFISINNFFTAYNRSDIDIQEKVLDIGEKIMYSPGESTYDTLNWENDPNNSTMLGLSASPLVAYGAFNLTQQGDIEAVSRYTMSGDFAGFARSCFLSGTKIVMADGSYKNIEDVVVGDLVKSFDVKTKTIVKRPVVNVFHHRPNEMGDYYLIINHRLKVTPNHMVYLNNVWKSFGSFSVGDTLDAVRISSIEKVYEKVPTYNLEIDGNHNYFVYFSDDSLLVHNTPYHLDDVSNIDWRPWLPVSKDVYPDDYGLESYGGKYYIDYTERLPASLPAYYLYEIKEKNNYPYPVLDAQKCLSLSNNELPYYLARSIFGLDDSQYVDYDLNITITNETDTLYSYGPSCVVPYVKASITRDVLIYYKPTLLSQDIYDIASPYYQKGKITLRLFLAAQVRYPSGSTPPPDNQPPATPTIKDDGPQQALIPLPCFYNTTTTDPNGDAIYYKWSWGDGTQSTWWGPYWNNTYAQQNHIWTSAGTYDVKVKAKDHQGAESSWSDDYPVTIHFGTYYKTITIHQESVVGTQINFPVFIYNNSDIDLKTYAKPSGDDIVFTDSNGRKLNFEIEEYDSSLGHISVWVKIPQISDTSDTFIRMYYNNSLLGCQENKVGVWDTNYHGVWHLNESSGALFESTSYGNDGTAYNGPTYGVDGKIATALSFDGAKNYVSCGDPADGSLDFGTNDFTVEFWVNTTETNRREIINKIHNPSGYAILIDNGLLLPVFAENNALHVLNPSSMAINDNNWHHVAVVFDRDANAYCYIDGNLDSETTISGWIGSTSNTLPFYIALDNFLLPPSYFNGIIDEVRTSNIARTGDWIGTQYYNIFKPEMFTTFGPQQSI